MSQIKRKISKIVLSAALPLAVLAGAGDLFDIGCLILSAAFAVRGFSKSPKFAII